MTTKLRDQVVSTLTYSGAKPDPRNLIAATEQYFGQIWKFTKSLEAAGDKNISLAGMDGSNPPPVPPFPRSPVPPFPLSPWCLLLWVSSTFYAMAF
jgi:hypothetical protein